MRAFCAAVVRGDEPRNHGSGCFYLRLFDEKKAVTGLPEVPSPWRHYLRLPREERRDPFTREDRLRLWLFWNLRWSP